MKKYRFFRLQKREINRIVYFFIIYYFPNIALGVVCADLMRRPCVTQRYTSATKKTAFIDHITVSFLPHPPPLPWYFDTQTSQEFCI